MMPATPPTGDGASPLFVHLSDIHFDRKDISHNGANVMARENLIDDLHEGVRHLGVPDAVLVTGDIAFSGQAHQYDEARVFLKRVTDTLGIEPEQVQVVPGNHDVDRGLVTGSVQATHEALRREMPIDADNRLPGLYREASDPLFAPMAAYRDFAVNYDCDVSGEYPFWETEWQLGRHSVLRMRGLTTCIVSDGDDRRANLIVGLRQASVATEARDDVVMVLGHHPTDWWHDMDECEEVMRDYVSLGLFGHKHVARLSVVDNSIRIVAGAVHPERHSDWVPRYNWVRVGVRDEDGPDPRLDAHIWSRVMLPSVNRFRSDSDEGGWNPHVKQVPLVRWARARRSASPAIVSAVPEQAELPTPPTVVEEPTRVDTDLAHTTDTGADEPVAMPAAPLVPQPPLAARAPVIAGDGRPERVRTAIYAFGELHFSAQMKLLAGFDLLEDGDQSLPPTEIRMRAFARLRASDRLDEFMAAIEVALRHDGDGRPPDPPSDYKESGN